VAVGPWGGYRNGEIPLSALRQLRAEPGDFMRTDAAIHFDAMATAFRADRGKGLVVREGYRNRATQQFYRTRYEKRLPGWTPAAVVGTSIHGWALAVDVAVDSFTSEDYLWLHRNAARFGFDNTRGVADREPWHWEFGNVRPTISVADLGDTTPIEDEMPSAKEIADAVWGTLLENPANGNLPTKAGDILRYGELSDAIRRDEILREVGTRVWETPIVRAGETNPDGSPMTTTAAGWLGYTQRFVTYLADKIDGNSPDPIVLDEAALGAEIAAGLAPLLPDLTTRLSDEDLARVAKAAADEADKRERERLAAAPPAA
jgi:hypothetical protein